MSPGERKIDETPIRSIQDIFVPRFKGKASTNFFVRRDNPIDQHVRTKVSMLVTVDVGRLTSIQSCEFIQLCLIDIPKLLPQHRVIKAHGILRRSQELNNAVMILGQRASIGLSRKGLGQIQV